MRLLLAVCVALAAALAGTGVAQRPAPRSDLRAAAWRETTPDSTQDAFKVVRRAGAHAPCTLEQLVRRGTRGHDARFPGSPPPHRHTHASEAFEVLRGKMGLSVAGSNTRLHVEGRATVAAGVAHFFFSAAPGDDLLVRFTLTPCGSHIAYFENLAGLAYDAGGRARVPWLQMVLLMHTHGLEMATVPRPVWRALSTLAAPLARELGYQAEYREYTSLVGAAA